MAKRALVVCTVACFLEFELNDIGILQSLGYGVHVASNFQQYENMQEKMKALCVETHQTDFARSPVSITNITAYRQMKQLMRKEEFDIVHCHTPVGGVLARLAAQKYRKRGMKVLYTAHGFHFFSGAPLKNWFIYYPVEKLCSYFTDILITINREDYSRAQRKLKAKKVVYIPGVGVDLKAFGTHETDRVRKRQELGIPEDGILLLSVGELNRNKNHAAVIQALREMEDHHNLYYVIAGEGILFQNLHQMILENGMEKSVKLLGYRDDIAELYDIADLFVLPSFREGLSVALMEAMASGLPTACSKIRGNTDLADEYGGCMFRPDSVGDIKEKILGLVELPTEIRKEKGIYNQRKVHGFDIHSIEEAMRKLYFSCRS